MYKQQEHSLSLAIQLPLSTEPNLLGNEPCPAIFKLFSMNRGPKTGALFCVDGLWRHILKQAYRQMPGMIASWGMKVKYETRNIASVETPHRYLKYTTRSYVISVMKQSGNISQITLSRALQNDVAEIEKVKRGFNAGSTCPFFLIKAYSDFHFLLHFLHSLHVKSVDDIHHINFRETRVLTQFT